MDVEPQRLWGYRVVKFHGHAIGRCQLREHRAHVSAKLEAGSVLRGLQVDFFGVSHGRGCSQKFLARSLRSRRESLASELIRGIEIERCLKFLGGTGSLVAV